MKKGLSIVILTAVFFLYAFNAAAETRVINDMNTVKVEINGQKTDIPTILLDEVTYVPLRSISEKFGKDVSWDAATRTAKVADSSTRSGDQSDPGIGKNIAFLLSTALLITGAIMLAQIIFVRTKRDLAIVLKATSSSSISAIALKRLIYTGWASRIGFIYILCGFLLRLSAQTSMNAVANTLLTILLLIILWFAGLWISKLMSNYEFTHEYEAVEADDTYKR